VRTVIITIVILVLGALSTPQSPAKELVEIKVRGYYFAAPATVPMIVAVEPAARNRMLVVEADSDDYFRSSAIELEGENEKRLHSVEFKSLPAGSYEIRARVLSKNEVLGSAVEGLVVTGIGSER
jgi:hypothetical protein